MSKGTNENTIDNFKKAVPIIHGIHESENLTDEEIIEMAKQIEFTIQYVKNKRNSDKPGKKRT